MRSSDPYNTAAQASRVATNAATRAAVSVSTTRDMHELHAAADLLTSVWGRSHDGAPIPADLMRSFAHAEGAVSLARNLTGGALVGVAVLVRAGEGSTYSLIAATATDATDRGIGRALKLSQRSWALDRGLTSMTWTFDPLVARNARFNLTKLGAHVEEYEPSFYGRPSDAVNRDDDADRLVARWQLDDVRVLAATEGTLPEARVPDDAEVLGTAPDERPGYLRDEHGDAWCRVPHNILALRRSDPPAAARWRTSVREVLSDAFARGFAARGATRDGWYHLTPTHRLPRVAGPP